MDEMEMFFVEGVKFKKYDYDNGTEKVFRLIDQDFFMFPELVGFTEVHVWFKNWQWHVVPM